MKIIAVDFDGTLCESKWPDIGTLHQEVINELVKQQAAGAKLILWTCREGQLLQAAVTWCLEHGLKFDAVNDNLEENKEHYGNNTRKVYADEYWDDKSVLVVKTGEATNVVYRDCCGDGGVTVKQWRRENVELRGLSADGRTGTFILPPGTGICFLRSEGGMTARKQLNGDGLKLAAPPPRKPKKKRWQIWKRRA